MRNLAMASMAAISICGAAYLFADVELKKAESPAGQAWLRQFIGEWTVESEGKMGPDQPPIRSAGSEKARAFGEHWIIAEGQINVMGTDCSSVLTLGHDAAKDKFVGTWIDTVQGHMWRYEGSLDPTGKVLTLDTEGPSMAADGEMAKYQDIYEFKDADHRILRSRVQLENGDWMEFMTANYRRKK